MAQELSFKFKADVDLDMIVKKFNVLLSELKSSLDKFGNTISLLDEAKIKREMDSIQTSYDTLGAKARKAGTDAGRLADELERSSKNGTLLSKAFQFNQIAQSMNMVVGALDKFVQPYVELDKQVKNIGTLLEGSGRDFQEYAKLATEASKKSADSAAGVAAAAYQTISAGIGNTNQEVMDFVMTASQVAAAGMATTESAVDGLSSVVNAFKNSSGDAKISLEDTSKVADTFFAAIKLGKTTFNEMNSAIASWVPSAAALGVSFDQGAAAIANLTAQGTPTSIVGTQLNAFFTLIQKGTGPLNQALLASGTNLQELQKKLQLPVKEGGGLVNVMKTIQDSANKAGQSVATLAGSVEATKIIQSLAGSEEKVRDSFKTYEGVLTEMANGASTTAFEVAAQSIDVRTKIFLNKVQASFSQFFDIVGTGAVTALNTVSQLGPAIASFAGLSQIMPTAKMLDGIKGIPKAFNSALPAVNSFSASLAKMIPGFAMIGTVAPPAFGAAGAAGAASGAATSAAWMTALSPILAIIAAAGALIAIFVYLYKNVEGFRDIIDGAMEVAEYGFTRLWDVFSKIGEVLLSLGGAIIQGFVLPITAVVDIISEIVEAFTGVTNEAITVEDVIKTLGVAFDFIIFQLNLMKATIDGFVAGIKSVTGSVSNIIKAIFSGDIAGAVKEFGRLGADAGNAMVEGMGESFRDATFDEVTKKMEEQFADGVKLKFEVQEFAGIDDLIESYKNTTIEIETLKVKSPDELTADEREQLDMLEKKAQIVAEKIGKLAPEAKAGFRTIVDETGAIQEVYDINIDKAQELAQKQGELNSAKTLDAQNEYSSNLFQQSQSLEEQKKKYDELVKEADALYKAGKTDEWKQKAKEVGDYRKKMEDARGTVVKLFQDGAKAGLLTSDATEKIGKQIGLNNEGIEAAKNMQADFTAEIEDSEDAAKSLGDAFADAMNKAKKGQSDAIGALAELARQLKSGEITRQQYDEQRKQEIETGKKAVKEVIYLTELEKQAKRDLGIVEGQRSKAVATSLQNAKKLFDTEKKSINNALEQKRIIAETARLESGREKTVIDDIAAQKDKLKALQQEREMLTEIYKLKLDDSGAVIDIGIRLGKDEKKSEIINDLNNQITQLNNDIAKEGNKNIELELRAKLEDEDLRKKLDELALSELRFEVQIGIKSQDDLLEKLKSNQARLTATIVEEQRRLDSLLSELGSEKGENQLSAERRAEIESEIKDRKNKLVALKKTELDGRSEIYSEEKSIRDKRFRELEERHNQEIQMIERRKQAELELNKAIIGSTSAGLSLITDKKHQNDIKKLEEMKEAEIITEAEYNKRKEDLEKEHQSRMRSIQDAARGAEIESQRQHDLALLKEREARERERLTALDPEKDKEAFERQQQKVDDLAKVIAEKGDLLVASAEMLQGEIGDIFNNLLGDDEALKDSARRMFATVSGILKASASATISKLIIDSLFATQTGLLALLAIPAIKGLVSGAINKILDPVLSAISSFHTGGRVDSPTLAIVGDAAQGRPGSNTEWILRDDHLWLVVTEAVRQQEHHILAAVSLLSSEIAQELRNITDSLDFSSIVGLMDTDVTVEKHLRQLEMVNKGLTRINEGVNSLSKSLNTQLSPDKTVRLLSEVTKLLKIQVDYNNEVTDADEYLHEYGQQELKIRSFAGGSGFLSKPELALVGDAGSNNPEIVLNNPQLQTLITEASKSGNEILIRKMDELIKVVENIDFDVYLNSTVVTDEVNRENNRRKRRTSLT